MHISTLVSVITADALRATIRALGILRDVRSSGLSLPRSLRGQNNVASLHAELNLLRGLGDLLIPVSTTRENSARSERLDTLFALLPQERSLRWIAEQLSDGLHPKLRGELVAADEMAMRSLEEKLARQLGSAAPRNKALELLNEESASWRLLEGSQLANRLIADHGFADTYGQARKRARTLMKDQAAGGRNGPKVRDVKALLRWHDSLQAQLGAVASATEVSPEFLELQDHMRALRTMQCRWLGLARLGRVPGLKEAGSDSLRQTLVETQKRLSVKLLMSLQRCYGPSKSNFRGLIESELA